ncbi:MAG: PD-(D/E)XK nuclease family protein [Pseudomonadota bacterium]
MQLTELDWSEALLTLDRGATLVTGNARLTRRVLGDHALRQQVAGHSVWQRADVLPWGAWLARLHEAALVRGVVADGEPAVLLSHVQVDALWRQVIEADKGERGLLQPAAAAVQARQARELCLGWRIDKAPLRSAADHEDVAAYLRWSDTLERHLADGGWLEPAALADHAMCWLERDVSLRPKALCLAGFEEFTPQQTALLELLVEWGVEVTRVRSETAVEGQAVRSACVDAEQEMRAAAHWARARLQANPAARLGIVVRDLNERRTAIMRELDSALQPVACRQPGHRLVRAWNLSLGVALADEPLVNDALLWLGAGRGELAFVDAGRVLRSPFFFGAEQEQQKRLALEISLRDRGELRPGLDTVAWLARGRPEKGEPGCPKLADALDDLSEQTRAVPLRQSPGAWALHFAELLTRAGWPGQRALDSHEHQAVQAWQALLHELTSLGTVQSAMTREEALSALRRLAQEQTFQPRLSPAPVQVLGLFEALGQQFDGLWVMGLHDGVWPEPPRPNPFLPSWLQRERQLPRATAARELGFAEQLTGELLGGAPEVIVSWPQRSGDEPLRPSPLITDLPETPLPAEMGADPWRTMLEAGEMETLNDEHAPVVANGGALRGGTGLFTDQSNCPFRAFAIHRLGAGSLDSPGEGLDARTRGTMVHRVLEGIWKALDSRQSLEALTTEERGELIAGQVASVVAWATRKQPSVCTARFAEMECRRLEALMEEWLMQELARADFQVLAREWTVSLNVGQISVTGKVDRVDELTDGSHVVIDYKTGEVKPNDWLGERPRDPQIPLYSLQYDEELSGVVVGRVRRHSCGWAGVVVNPDEVPGSKAPDDPKSAGVEWDALREQWWDMANALAANIMQGDARVDPLPKACDYCHLAGLCRVNEVVAQAVAEEENNST